MVSYTACGSPAKGLQNAILGIQEAAGMKCLKNAQYIQPRQFFAPHSHLKPSPSGAVSKTV